MILIWTEEARKRLQDIRSYISEDSSEIAERTVAQLIGRIERLKEHSALGHSLGEYPYSDIRELLVRSYRIVYEVTGEQIVILTILHYRQLIPKRFGKD